jgi:hyperosmotically inducible periplasmic protein
MKNFILGIFFGIIILIAGIWYYGNKRRHVNSVQEDFRNAAIHAKAVVEDKLDSAHLTPDDIKDELARTGKIVRQKAEAAGAVVADAATDARITSTIKAKLIGDPGLSTLSISVTTKDGVVTLSGTASSAENIRKAFNTAMDTDGVHKVISTIQVKKT